MYLNLSSNFKKVAVPYQIAVWNESKHSTLYGKIVAICWQSEDDDGNAIYVWDDENILGSGFVTIIDLKCNLGHFESEIEK